MRILVTGGTGLVGSALVPLLTAQGHDVFRLTRHPSASVHDIPWNPEKRFVAAERLEGCEAVIHLAGENIASGRWTEAQKARIKNSRVEGTRFLAEQLLKLETPPRVFISASAIGYYGDRGDEVLTEAASPGHDFLAAVCQGWESSAALLEQRGTRVVFVRTGVVLSAKGGALAKMLPIFQLGGGGKLGSGNQFMSWIALDDLVGIYDAVLQDEAVSGPVNAVSPNPVRNVAFTAVLGHVLNRPTFMPVPAFGLRLLLGEMADALLLSSTQVQPEKILAAGYSFRYPELEGALRHVLGK